MDLEIYPYQRVIPRDLFNEAKLLKCMGFLCLAIHDGKFPNLKISSKGGSFQIKLSDEGLFISNLNVFKKQDKILSSIFFVSTYNSKSNFPLHFELAPYEYYEVFKDNGEFSQEFLNFVES